jgi:hypothetical protein
MVAVTSLVSGRPGFTFFMLPDSRTVSLGEQTLLPEGAQAFGTFL